MTVGWSSRSVGACTLACACSLGAATAFSAPVVPPSELIGGELGTPLQPGYYLFDTAAYGGTPNGSRDGFNIPIFLASLPSTVLGARVDRRGGRAGANAGRRIRRGPMAAFDGWRRGIAAVVLPLSFQET